MVTAPSLRDLRNILERKKALKKKGYQRKKLHDIELHVQVETYSRGDGGERERKRVQLPDVNVALRIHDSFNRPRYVFLSFFFSNPHIDSRIFFFQIHI